MMVPLVLLGVIGFIVPLYRKVIRLSTYEYFERRFGAFARFYSSVAFVLEHFSKMGTILYLLAMAMVAFTGGMDIVWIIVGVGVAVIILTYFGGMEAIIWMDVVQGFLLIIGGLLAVGVIFYLTDGGPSAIMDIAMRDHKIDFGPYAWDFTQLTFIVMVFNGIFYALQKYGTDQSIVQRYLTARSDKEARRLLTSAYCSASRHGHCSCLLAHACTLITRLMQANCQPDLKATRCSRISSRRRCLSV